MTDIVARIETPDLSPSGLARLGEDWRTLEAASDCSFFQSWTWIGCRIAQRYNAARLVRAWRAGRLVGLALFNRRALGFAPRALWLHETGDAGQDRVFVERNGPLVARDWAGPARDAILRAAIGEAGTVVLGGIDRDLVAAAARIGTVRVRGERAAWVARLSGADAAGFRAGLGRSTRMQIARTERRLGAGGELHWRRATDLEAAADLELLADLHRRRWARQGHAGAFGKPEFRDFASELVARGMPRGEVGLATLASQDAPVCVLLELRWRGTVSAYQSGVDFDRDRLASPGLLAHVRSIEDAIGRGDAGYDLLAGDGRYKRSLSNGSDALFWVEVSRRRSLRRVALGALALLRRGARAGVA